MLLKVLQTPWLGPEHINEKKPVLFKVRIVFLFCRWLHSRKLSIHTYWNCLLDE